jgi:hypothetical protein
MPEVIASYDPGADITVEASAALTGGRCVGVPTSRNAGGPAGISDTGDGVLVCGLPAAGAPVFGVASFDAAVGKKTNVMKAPKVVPIECSAAIAIGAEVMSGADGRIATRTAGNSVIGRALTATTAAGQFCQVELYSGGALTLT